MTECGGTNIEHPTCFCPGSVGPVVDGYQVVIEKFNDSQEDGEVCQRRDPSSLLFPDI